MVSMVTIPNTTMAMIGSVPMEVRSANFTAPTIRAMKPPRVRTAIVVPMVAIAFVKFIEITSAGSVSELFRFAPHRLQ
jgi:hypothetical protein